MEEGKVSSNEVVRYARRLIQYVNLTAENILGLFICVCRYIACGSCCDAVES